MILYIIQIILISMHVHSCMLLLPEKAEQEVINVDINKAYGEEIHQNHDQNFVSDLDEYEEVSVITDTKGPIYESII